MYTDVQMQPKVYRGFQMKNAKARYIELAFFFFFSLVKGAKKIAIRVVSRFGILPWRPNGGFIGANTPEFGMNNC